jgi:hypothetical protein
MSRRNFFTAFIAAFSFIVCCISTTFAADIENISADNNLNEPQIEIQSQADDSSDPGFTIFQYSIFSPIQLYPDNYDVYGVRLNLIYGENNSMYGADFGFYSALKNNMYGVQLAAVACSRDGDAMGVSAATIANMSIGNDGGLSMAGFMSLASGEFSGLQIAAVCRAQRFKGVQVGVFNHCDDFKGFQFGLVNICRNQYLPFTILLNFRF